MPSLLTGPTGLTVSLRDILSTEPVGMMWRVRQFWQWAVVVGGVVVVGCGGITQTDNGRDAAIDSAGGSSTGSALCNKLMCNGKCVDPSTDENNCGGCGVACEVAGQTCREGTCACELNETLCGTACCRGTCTNSRCLVTLASGQDPAGIAVDSNSVYFTNPTEGTLMRVAIHGGAPVVLASGQAVPHEIAVHDASVYWTNSGYAPGSGTVMKLALTGGAPISLVSGLNEPFGIAVAATSVYWTEKSAVVKISLGGGSPTTLASGQSGPRAIAVDGSNVYWTNSVSYSGTIMKVPLTGGTPTVLASGQDWPDSIAVDHTNVYWTDHDGGTAMTVPLGGGQVTTLAAGQDYPSGIAVDDAAVYWSAAGALMKVGLGGGSPLALVTAQPAPYEIVVDAPSLYWTNLAENRTGTVMKLTPK